LWGGHVYILGNPLFRVRNKKEVYYCYSEKERDEAVKRINAAEVPDSKGWER